MTERIKVSDVSAADIIPTAKASDNRERISVSEINEADAVPVEAPGNFESFVSGLANGLTFGLSDEIIGGARAAVGKFMLGEEGSIDALYEKYRDAQREHKKLAKATSPKSNMAGNLVGIAVPGVGAANTVKGAMAVGATGGAVQAYGENENPETALRDTAVGAAAGAVGGGLLAGAQKVAQASGLTNWVRNLAGKQAYKATTGQNIKAFRRIGGTEEAAAKQGQEFLDAGIMNFGSNSSSIRDKAADKLADVGKKLGDTRGALDDAFAKANPTEYKFTNELQPVAQTAKMVDGGDVAKKMRAFGKEIDHPNTRSFVKIVNETADEVEKMGKMTLAELEKLKRRFPYKNPKEVAATNLPAEVNRGLYMAAKDSAEEAVAKAGDTIGGKGKSVLADYVAQKKSYGALKNATQNAEERSIRELSNRFLSPTDYATALAAYVGNATKNGGGDPITGIVKGAITGFLHKQVRERGNSAAAVSMSHLGDLLQSQGYGSLGSAHVYLLKNDPEYRELFFPKDKGKGDDPKPDIKIRPPRHEEKPLYSH